MKEKHLAVSALVALIFLILWVSITVSAFEIRGPLALSIDGATYEQGPKKANNEFYGFYYDLDDNLGTESIMLVVSRGNVLDGNTHPAGIQYVTEVQDNGFALEDWGSYKSIGFLGENYFAGHIADDDQSKMSILAKESEKGTMDTLSQGLLYRVLIDEDEDGLIELNRPLTLKEGYELRLRSADIDGKRAYVDLYRGEELQDSKVVSPEKEDAIEADKTYYYKMESGKSTGLVTIAVHFNRVFKGIDGDAASFDGIFQLSQEPEVVRNNQLYDNMTVTSLTGSRIVMENLKETVILNKHQDDLLMRGIRIRTADQTTWDPFEDPLRFYVYREIVEPGQHLINGRVEDLVDGRLATWDYTNFPGFFYDLDKDLGSERLDIKIKGDGEESTLEPSNVTYRTDAQAAPFQYERWGRYYAIGYMGEKYLAGYVTYEDGRTAFLWDYSDESNLMANNALSRILIDNRDLTNLSEGSAYPLEEGYELRIKDIDTYGKRVLVGLAKDGVEINQSILDISSDPTYRYMMKLEGGNEIPLIAVNFEDLLGGVETSIAEINGTWQISEKLQPIGEGRKLGKLRIDYVSSREGEMSIEASNEDTIHLAKDETIYLMGNYGIKTADQRLIDPSNPLRFFVFKNVTI